MVVLRLLVGKDYSRTFFKDSVGIQHVYTGAQECINTSRSRLSCHCCDMDYSSLENPFGSNDYDVDLYEEQEKKGGSSIYLNSCSSGL